MKTSSKGVIIVALIVLAGIIYFSVTNSGSGGTGTLTMQLTDAPSNLNISSAIVTLSSIEVHTSAIATSTTPNSTSNQTNSTSSVTTAGWTTIVSGPVTYDLIKLINVTQLLGSQQLAAGHYTQIRLAVTSAVVTINGQSFTLTVPSDKIKLVHEFTITAGKTTTLTLDFSAQDSIKQAGPNYILQPTITVLQK